MITIRKAEERGRTRSGWLDSRHTFSFNRYYDRDWAGFGPLQVINDDLVAPSAGFPAHAHRDMEVLTWILDGALAHKDSTGAEGEIRPGDLQKMSAGTGIQHSEFNPSRTKGVRLLQIWIEPEQEGLAPSYDQRHFPLNERRNRLLLIAAENGRDGTVPVYQKADVYTAVLDEGASVEHRSPEGRRHWVQVAKGTVELNGSPLKEGDGAAVTGETLLRLAATSPAEIILFDMA